MIIMNIVVFGIVFLLRNWKNIYRIYQNWYYFGIVFGIKIGIKCEKHLTKRKKMHKIDAF